VKNVLARVVAGFRGPHRRGGTTEEVVQTLDGRIRAMAGGPSLLRPSILRGGGLNELAKRHLRAYTNAANVVRSGPEITLTSAQTQAVTMVMHELVTNAAKYGALSDSDGSVAVSWDRTGADTILTITWRERGGPPIAAPVKCGYGSSLIRDLIP